jgi:hypothetical protein
MLRSEHRRRRKPNEHRSVRRRWTRGRACRPDLGPRRPQELAGVGLTDVQVETTGLTTAKFWNATDETQSAHQGVWLPGETLIIDWGCEDGLHVFCAVLAWSRLRFAVRCQ